MGLGEYPNSQVAHNWRVARGEIYRSSRIGNPLQDFSQNPCNLSPPFATLVVWRRCPHKDAV
jgi:hypothetical protein